MQKYWNTVQDEQGRPRYGASVAVQQNGVNSSIFSTSTGTAKANPLTSDSTRGYFEFFAAAGAYDLVVSGVGFDAYTISSGAEIGLPSNDVTFTPSGTGLIPSTTANNVSAALGVLDSAGGTIRSQLRVQRMATGQGLTQRTVMGTPPAVTYASVGSYTARTIASPLAWRAVNETGFTASGVTGEYFSYFGCNNIVQAGPLNPNYFYITLHDITNTTGAPAYNNGFFGVAFYHYGAELEISVKGAGGSFYVKIDGQYISLTPQAVASDGNLYTYYIPFGSTAERRIEVHGAGLTFGGVFTAQTDTIRPAPLRGPKTIVLGDSFTEGTGATNTWLDCYVRYMADYLGWDDVAPSGLGATGYLATGGGSKPYFSQRVATDVIAYAPEVVIVAGGINDSTTGLQAEALSLFNTIKAGLPNALLIVVSPFSNGGVNKFSSTLIARRDAIKTSALAAGAQFIDVLELPLPSWTTAVSTTLAAGITSGVSTSFSSNGPLAPRQHVKIDSERFEVTAVSGGGPYTCTINGTAGSSHLTGAAITNVGPPLWTGIGRVGALAGYGNSDIFVSSDTTHPTTVGHEALGKQIAQQILALRW